MTLKNFICPDGTRTPVRQCLNSCPFKERCMSIATLNAIAGSNGPRNLGKFSVTELLRGTRESYYIATLDYDIIPAQSLTTLLGTAVHSVNELAVPTGCGVITEQRLENDIATGQIDAYGKVLGDSRQVILDYKLTTAYKAMQALGFVKTKVDTGTVYKTGQKKGLPKYKTVWKRNGRRHTFEWALQQNFYRMLLEEQGYKVDGMYIQMFIRDYGGRNASEFNITQQTYLIRLNKISDHWLRIWFARKRDKLKEALSQHRLPDPCTPRETWGRLKCREYCTFRNICNIGRLFSKT